MKSFIDLGKVQPEEAIRTNELLNKSSGKFSNATRVEIYFKVNHRMNFFHLNSIKDLRLTRLQQEDFLKTIALKIFKLLLFGEAHSSHTNGLCV